ncbi:MAG TPA: CBS domain-containing protein [Opitutaceae bacterium]|nr:CBS domain-containing protein [Opitutaceae bacterium]
MRATDPLKTAYKRMRFADVSQLPVLDEAAKRLVGVVDEKTLLNRMTMGDKNSSMSGVVADVMREAAPVLPKDTPIETAAPLLQQGGAIMVVDEDKFLGVVTRVDMLNHLYLKGQVA